MKRGVREIYLYVILVLFRVISVVAIHVVWCVGMGNVLHGVGVGTRLVCYAWSGTQQENLIKSCIDF